MKVVFLAAALVPSLALCAFAQSKVEISLTREAQSERFVRVLIVTRPEPGAVGGSTSYSRINSYLSGTLGKSAATITQIGSLPVAAAEIDASALEKLNADPNVVLVTKDTPVPPTLMDSVPEIGGTTAHTLGLDGHGYSVAILDTGVDVTHPALAGSVVAEACFSTPSSTQYQIRSLCPGGYDISLVSGAAGGCPTSIEGCEHGTHVAGIIAGHDMKYGGKSFEGVAPKAKIVAVQVFTQFLGPQQCGGRDSCVMSFTSDQLRALDWIYKQADKYKIASINMSLGSGYHNTPCDLTSALTEIIERLQAKGVATVVAAGNDHYYDGIAEPACISSTISVAAETKSGMIDVAYSNRSPLVHFIAPGTNITSAVPGGGYKTLSGTSMAAPHVAAAFAAIKSQNPDLTVREIETKLSANGPLVEDVTTGEKFRALSLVGAQASVTSSADSASPPASISAPSTTTAPEPNDPARTVHQAGPAASGSYIVQTDRSAGELKSSVESACQSQRCDLKALTADSYKLDVFPKDPTKKTAPSAADLQHILGPGNRVFENKMFSPF